MLKVSDIPSVLPWVGGWVGVWACVCGGGWGGGGVGRSFDWPFFTRWKITNNSFQY